MIVLIILLSAILGIGPVWLAEIIQKRTSSVPPVFEEDADALPFGPPPREQD